MPGPRADRHDELRRLRQRAGHGEHGWGPQGRLVPGSGGVEGSKEDPQSD